MQLAGTKVLHKTRVIAHRLAVASACCEIDWKWSRARARILSLYVLNVRIGTCLFSHWPSIRSSHTILMDIILMTCSCRFLMPFSFVFIFGRTIIFIYFFFFYIFLKCIFFFRFSRFAIQEHKMWSRCVLRNFVNEIVCHWRYRRHRHLIGLEF